MCAIDLDIKSSKLIILNSYRPPKGYFNQFIENLDDALKYLYKPRAEFSICGDVNTDNLNYSNQKQKQLTSLLTTHALSHTVRFATRIQNNSIIAIGNKFVGNIRINLSSPSPLINGLSDHDAQILTIKNIYATINKLPLKNRTILTV